MDISALNRLTNRRSVTRLLAAIPLLSTGCHQTGARFPALTQGEAPDQCHNDAPTWTFQTSFGSVATKADLFDSADGVAVSPDGLTMWVTDSSNFRVSVLTRPDTGSTRWMQVSSFGEEGASAGQFLGPSGIAVTPNGLSAWVTDKDDGRISVWTRPDATSTNWSHQATFGDEYSEVDHSYSRWNIAVSADGLTVWVTESESDLVSVWARSDVSSTDWTHQTNIGGPGEGARQFGRPSDVAVSPDGLTVWVADTNNSRISIWTRPDATSTNWSHQTNFGREGDNDLYHPGNIAVAPDGLSAWISEAGPNQISVWTRPDATSRAWARLTTIDDFEVNVIRQFGSMSGVAVSADGLTAWVSDNIYKHVSIWTRPDAASTTWVHQTTVANHALDTDFFDYPSGVAVAPDGLTVWVADSEHHRISVWTRPDTDSTNWANQTTFGIEGESSWANRGANGPENFVRPRGVAVSPDGLTVWVVDELDRVSVWTRPDATSTQWINYATFGSAGDGAHEFSNPWFVATSPDGLTAWVADYQNERISVWTRPDATSGNWTNQTTFGSYGSGTDQFTGPGGVAVSPDGLTVWVADTYNNRIAVWERPDATSTNWTFQSAFDVNHAMPETRIYSSRVTVAADGLSIWVPDLEGGRISVWTRPDTSSTEWTPQTTFGGKGSGDDEFEDPRDVAVSPDGRTLWVADAGNNRISVWTLDCTA